MDFMSITAAKISKFQEILPGKPTGFQKSMHSLAGWGAKIKTMPRVIPFLVTRGFETTLPELLGFRNEIDDHTAALFPKIQFNGAMTSRSMQSKEPWALYGPVADPSIYFYFIANGGLLAEDRELNGMRKGWKTDKQIWMDDFEPRGMSFSDFRSYSRNNEAILLPDTSPGLFYAKFVMFHKQHLRRKRKEIIKPAPMLEASEDSNDMASLSILFSCWHPDTTWKNRPASESSTSVTSEKIAWPSPSKKHMFIRHKGIEGPLTKRRKLNSSSPKFQISNSDISRPTRPSLLSRRMGRSSTPLWKDLAGQPVLATPYQPLVNKSNQTYTLPLTVPGAQRHTCLDSSDPISQALFGFLKNGEWSLRPRETTDKTLEVMSDSCDSGVQIDTKEGVQSGSDPSQIMPEKQKVKMSTAPAYFDRPVSNYSKVNEDKQEFFNAIIDAEIRSGQPFPSKPNYQELKKPISKQSKKPICKTPKKPKDLSLYTLPHGTINEYDAHGNVTGCYIPQNSVSVTGQPLSEKCPTQLTTSAVQAPGATNNAYQRPMHGSVHDQIPPQPYPHQYPVNNSVDSQMPPPPKPSQHPVNGPVSQMPPPPKPSEHTLNGVVNGQILPPPNLSRHPVHGGSNNEVPYQLLQERLILPGRPRSTRQMRKRI
ncbi:hypothetical protein VTL71DRAFT_2579 [Oculimacula yallundae]|uniref:Uncharacterized protein n=1 Tax=Oculimacula yallundae TaxID=86028 RepID=A0ABR4C9A3_9HELO